ncbi:hypothetical protein SLS64_005128, partial [Diaporthe eres]
LFVKHTTSLLATTYLFLGSWLTDLFPDSHLLRAISARARVHLDAEACLLLAQLHLTLAQSHLLIAQARLPTAEIFLIRGRVFRRVRQGRGRVSY